MLDDFKVFIHVFTWECISKQIILANYENVWCGIIRLLWTRLGDFYKYVWHILTRDSTNSYLNLLYVLQTYDPFNLVKFTFVPDCIKSLIPTKDLQFKSLLQLLSAELLRRHYTILFILLLLDIREFNLFIRFCTQNIVIHQSVFVRIF